MNIRRIKELTQLVIDLESITTSYDGALVSISLTARLDDGKSEQRALTFPVRTGDEAGCADACNISVALRKAIRSILGERIGVLKQAIRDEAGKE